MLREHFQMAHLIHVVLQDVPTKLEPIDVAAILILSPIVIAGVLFYLSQGKKARGSNSDLTYEFRDPPKAPPTRPLRAGSTRPLQPGESGYTGRSRHRLN